MIEMWLPVPPSTNNLYLNVRGHRGGRIKAPRYRLWLKQAGLELLVQRPRPVHGPYRLSIELPRSTRGDVGNREKAISDLLVAHGLIDDDRYAVAISISKNGQPGCYAHVRVQAEHEHEQDARILVLPCGLSRQDRGSDL